MKLYSVSYWCSFAWQYFTVMVMAPNMAAAKKYVHDTEAVMKHNQDETVIKQIPIKKGRVIRVAVDE